MLDKKHIRTFRSKKLHPEHVKLINEAIRHNAKGKQKDVIISYKKENGETSDRKVRPFAVKDKSLFLAHCHERNAIRSFRVERISMVKQAFWDGFVRTHHTKTAGTELTAWGVRHDGKHEVVSRAWKAGPWHLYGCIQGDSPLHNEEHYWSPRSHAQVAEYAKHFKKSVDDFGDPQDKSDLHAFADNLHAVSKSKKYKHFELHMG